MYTLEKKEKLKSLFFSNKLSALFFSPDNRHMMNQIGVLSIAVNALASYIARFSSIQTQLIIPYADNGVKAQNDNFQGVIIHE